MVERGVGNKQDEVAADDRLRHEAIGMYRRVSDETEGMSRYARVRLRESRRNRVGLSANSLVVCRLLFRRCSRTPSTRLRTSGIARISSGEASFSHRHHRLSPLMNSSSAEKRTDELLAPGFSSSRSAFSSSVKKQMAAVVRHVPENDLRHAADVLAAGKDHDVAAFDEIRADVLRAR